MELAVIGMFIQHFALQPWSNFVSGNTMILFILCSGISYSMMAQGMWKRGTAEPVFRARVLARALFIDLVGYVILMLNGPFGVVLQAYAMLFLLAMPLVRRSTKSLIVISVIAFLACPPVMLVGMSLFEGAALLSDIAGRTTFRRRVVAGICDWHGDRASGPPLKQDQHSAGCNRYRCCTAGETVRCFCSAGNLSVLLQLARPVFLLCRSSGRLCAVAQKYSHAALADAVHGCTAGRLPCLNC